MEDKKRRKRTKTSTFGSPGREGHDSTRFYSSKLYSSLPSEKSIEYTENQIPPNF
jgi:site-specific DNA-methyltransferase (adenine-specific)